MKKIIDGKTYNTETSTLICEKEYYDNGNWSWTHTLYKTQKGSYFFTVIGSPRDIHAPDDSLEIATEAGAKAFVEKHGTAEEYESEWGEAEEG